jgi:glycosidase
MTYPGAPSIFYGDEIGLEGGLPDPDTRRTFPWDRPHLWKRDVLAYHKELIALRKAHPALRRGTYHRLYVEDPAGGGADADVYAFGRKLDADVLLVAVNRAEAARSVEIPTGDLFGEGAALRAIYGNGEGRVRNGKLALTIAPRSGVVMTK